MTGKQALEHAAELHRRMLSFDAHMDVSTAPASVGEQFSVSQALAGGLSGAALTVHATARRPSATAEKEGLAELESRFSIIQGLAAAEASQIALSARDFRRIAAEGKFAIVLSLQNAAPFADSLDAFDAWAARGVRMLAFNFIGNNQWSDSARPYPFVGGGMHWGGLSALGKRGVQRLNDLGLIIDVSQGSSEALRDILSCSRAPVIASHSAVRALVDTDRNFSDAELLALKGNGGVIHIVAFAPYLRPLDTATLEALKRHWAAYGLPPPRSVSDFLSVNDAETTDWPEDRFFHFLHEFHEVLDLDHPKANLTDLVAGIDHAVQLIGIDHVGIGSDFNHAGGVIGWQNVGETLNVTAALLERGYDDVQIAKLWGGNFLRVWESVERARTRPIGP